MNATLWIFAFMVNSTVSYAKFFFFFFNLYVIQYISDHISRQKWQILQAGIF